MAPVNGLVLITAPSSVLLASANESRSVPNRTIRSNQLGPACHRSYRHARVRQNRTVDKGDVGLRDKGLELRRHFCAPVYAMLFKTKQSARVRIRRSTPQ
jgi:hypothetical protein